MEMIPKFEFLKKTNSKGDEVSYLDFISALEDTDNEFNFSKGTVNPTILYKIYKKKFHEK